MIQKRCLNCQDYRPDLKGLNGEPLPKGTFPYSGVCQQTNTRMKDGWACGNWIKKGPWSVSKTPDPRAQPKVNDGTVWGSEEK